MVQHLLSLKDFTPAHIADWISYAQQIKASPEKYSSALRDKTLLMIFAKPSLRTRVSFEVGMTQMGGHGIYYNISTSPMGKKESIADTARTASRYVDMVMARLFEHKDIEEFAKHSSVPVINALTNFSHPCQIVADLMTINEKKGDLKGLKLAYLGDSNNNVTYSLLYGCALAGINISIACPQGTQYEPKPEVVREAQRIAQQTGASVTITNVAEDAAREADVIYTDSWMSYHIPQEQKTERIKLFTPYQVNKKLMAHAKEDALFMNCLPALRGFEQSAEVIDGAQSVVFNQAENRLHAQKAIMLRLLGL